MSASLLCCLTGAGSPRATNVNAAEAKRPLSNALIVHPMFVKQLTTKPSSFCPMDWLPDEVITNVLVHLNGTDAARFAAVNKRAARLVNDDTLWRQIFASTFRFDVPEKAEPPSDCGGWRGVYKQHLVTLYRLARGDKNNDGNGSFGSDSFGRGLRNMGHGRVGAVHVYHGGTLVST